MEMEGNKPKEGAQETIPVNNKDNTILQVEGVEAKEPPKQDVVLSKFKDKKKVALIASVVVMLLILFGFGASHLKVQKAHKASKAKTTLVGETVETKKDLNTPASDETGTITDLQNTDIKKPACLEDFSFSKTECITLSLVEELHQFIFDGRTVNISNIDSCNRFLVDKVGSDRLIVGCGKLLYIIDSVGENVVATLKLPSTLGLGTSIRIFEGKTIVLVSAGYENGNTITHLINPYDANPNMIDIQSYGTTKYNEKWWFDLDTIQWGDNEITIQFAEIADITPKEEEYDIYTFDEQVADSIEQEVEDINTNKYLQVVCHLGDRMTGIGNTFGCVGLVKVNEYKHSWQ